MGKFCPGCATQYLSNSTNCHKTARGLTPRASENRWMLRLKAVLPMWWLSSTLQGDLKRGAEAGYVLGHLVLQAPPLNCSVDSTKLASGSQPISALALAASGHTSAGRPRSLPLPPSLTDGETEVQSLYTPVLGLNLCFNKALKASREKFAKFRILAPCQLPAPRTWASLGHGGLAARAAPSGNRDVTLRSACRRSPQAQCAFVYSKRRLSAGGVTVVVHRLSLAYTVQRPQLRAKRPHLYVSSVSASDNPEQ